LDPFWQVHVFLGTPEQDSVLQVKSCEYRAEVENHFPRPAGHTIFIAALGTVGLLVCKHTMLVHVQFFNHQYLQVILCRVTFNPFILWSVLILGIAPTQVQGLALGLIEPHVVLMGPFLEPVKVPLDGVISLQVNQLHNSALCHLQT